MGLAIDLVGEPATVVDSRIRRVDLVFRARLVRDDDADGVHPTSPEISRAAWFRPDELPELQDETVQALAALARTSTPPAP